VDPIGEGLDWCRESTPPTTACCRSPFAGLYELWPDPDKDKDDPDRWLWTAVIITTDATGPAGEAI
jgi:hypothetical protein